MLTSGPALLVTAAVEESSVSVVGRRHPLLIAQKALSKLAASIDKRDCIRADVSAVMARTQKQTAESWKCGCAGVSGSLQVNAGAAASWSGQDVGMFARRVVQQKGKAALAALAAPDCTHRGQCCKGPGRGRNDQPLVRAPLIMALLACFPMIHSNKEAATASTIHGSQVCLHNQ